MRDAERAVWEVFQQLDYSWHVFYSARENSGSGWDREVDFILIRLNRIFYCEVKGGIVVVDQRAGPGVTWAHFKRSGEAINKRADPKQLWLAKTALGETIRKISGQSPRDLGFREHDFYIFPHTSKDVTLGADLERGNTHYAFAEDIDALPVRLQHIVDAGKGRFINRARIMDIISSLDAMVLKESEGTLPHPVAKPYPSIAAIVSGPTQVFSNLQMQRGAAHFWKRQFLPWVCGVAVFLIILALPVWDQPARPVSKSQQSPRTGSNEFRSSSRPPAPASKPSAKDVNAALPSFIAPASESEVERALAAAQDQAVYVSWQSGAQHGLVILRADEGNGCRLYQISRNDLQPAVYDFVRRCF